MAVLFLIAKTRISRTQQMNEWNVIWESHTMGSYFAMKGTKEEHVEHPG